MPNSLSHLSLFTGIGGVDLSAEAADFVTVGQVEIDDYCNTVLEHYWPDVPRWRDVGVFTGEEFTRRTGIKRGELALLSGGFPCQPFSVAGNRGGESDERYLWGEMYRVICEIRPRWVLGENVRGLLSIDAGRTFGRILGDLAKAGYRVGWLCYGAGDVGAPHKRERVFIVGYSEHNGPLATEVTRGITSTGNDIEERETESCQFARAGLPRNGQDVADTRGGGFGEPNICCQQQGRAQTVWTGEDISIMEDSRRELRQRPFICGTNEAEDCGRHAHQHKRSSGTSSDDMANSGGERLAGCVKSGNATSERAQSYEQSARRNKLVCGKGKARKAEGAVEPRLGECADGVSTRLAEHRWPAGPGDQHEWEPPRLVVGHKNRVAKLKALGNAVVPQQVYPILKAIAERLLSEGDQPCQQ